MSELMFAIIVDFLGVDVVTVYACFEKRIKQITCTWVQYASWL